MRTRPRVGVRLLHQTRLVKTSNSVTVYYRIQVVWAERPSKGVRTGRIRCEICHQLVGFRLHSVAETWARKRWWSAVALVGAAVLAIVATLTFTLDVGSTPAAVPSGLGVGWGLGGFVVLFGVGAFFSEDGVRADRSRRNGPHGFRPPNVLLACVTPADTGEASSSVLMYDD